MKKLLLIYCICLCSFFTYTQTTSPSPPNLGVSSYALQDYKSSLQKNTPPSVAAFHETKLVSVNNHRGAANINVPLYQIQQGGVTVPIRLNYLSTGVKVNSIASSVGLNWSLEAGGSIIKDIRGFEDFTDSMEGKTVAPSKKGQPAKKVMIFHKKGWLAQKNTTLADINQDKDAILEDLDPDHFYVNAPGLSTTFTHKKTSSNNTTEPFEVNFKGTQIKTTIGQSNLINFKRLQNIPYTEINDPKTIRCINNIQIRNNQGVSYVFDKLDVDEYYARQIPSSETSANIPALKKSTYSREVKSYHLSTIKDLNGDEIRFEYETYKMTISNYDRTQVWDINRKVPELRKSIFTSVFYPQIHRIKKIHFKNGSVEFFYGFNRTDLEDGGKALSEIIVRDKLGTFIKKIKLSYSYFISNNNCNNYYCKRLQLKEVYNVDKNGIKLPAHKFFYDPKALPVVGATTTDYLGYSKGLKSSYTQDLNLNIPMQAPKLTFEPGSTPSFYPIKSGDLFSVEIKGRDLTPVFDYAKAGSLVKMITPTGAIQEFEYELNSFSGSGSTDIPAAGLRIKRQTITNEKGNVVLLENYTYKNEIGNSSGVVNYLPPFVQTSSAFNFMPVTYTYTGHASGQALRIRTYLSSTKENQLSNPGHVVYSKVTVKNGLNNGITTYKYTTLKHHPAEFSSDYHNGEYIQNKKFIKDNFLDRTILYGRLLRKETKDVYDSYIKSMGYGYHFHVFDRLSHNISIHKFRTAPLGEDPIDYKDYINKETSKSKIYSQRVTQNSISDLTISPETYINDEKITEFKYDSTYPFVKEKKDIISKKETLITKYYYPTDITSINSLGTPNLSTSEFNTIRLLKNKRMLSIPIQIETYLNNNKLSTKRFNYKNFGNYIYAPKSLSQSKGNNNLEVSIRQKYDTTGNLVELRRENGASVVYIYGYNKSFLVAKIENAMLSDIPASYISSIQMASDRDTDRTLDIVSNNGAVTNHVGTEGNLRKELYKLYSLNSLKNAMITVYTFDPLIGVTSITDNRKIITYFDYDTFNRLQLEKDNQGNVIKKYCYNYKGEKKKCDKNN